MEKKLEEKHRENMTKGLVVNIFGLAILSLVSIAMHLEKFAAIALAINYVVFFVHALPQGSEKFFDATGSITYLCLVLCALLFPAGSSLRQLVNPIMVIVWCVRLGSFLLARILRDGKDARFDELKQTWLRWLSIWTIQSLWCFLVASPVLVTVTSESCTIVPGFLDYVGWCLWICGFLFEVIADRQKDYFRRDPANKDKFISSGLWAYSRHPNYFGEIIMWVGLCVSGSSCFHSLDWLAWLSPVTTWILLLKVTGVPMLEKAGSEKWGLEPAYCWYMAKTPCIVPRLTQPEQYRGDDYLVINE